MSSQPQWRPEAWQLTDQGMSRDHNEDYCDSFDPDDPAVLAQRGRLWLVADGIGGHQAGDVASKYAVEKVLYAYYEEPWVEPAHNLVQAIQDANADLYEEAQRNPAHRGMGTTMVAAVLLGDGLIVANVGDSRAYLFRDGDPRQITRDHSWVAEQVERGVLTPQQARAHPERNVITRSLGNDPHVRVDVFRETLRSGDVVVLCSDGLSGVVLDGEIAGMVEGAHARTASERLVRLANERGGPDNVTVTVIRMATHVPSPTPVRIPSKEESTPVAPLALSRRSRTSSRPQWVAVGMIVVALVGLAVVVRQPRGGEPPTVTPTGRVTGLPGLVTGATPTGGETAVSEAPTATVRPTSTLIAPHTPSPSATNTPVPTESPSATVSATSTATPSSTATASATPSASPSPTATVGRGL